MEDFYIFTVNDTTDSSLEEYNSEVDLENEETNINNNGIVISQETSHFNPEQRFESNESNNSEPPKVIFKNLNLMEELKEVSTIVSNKNNNNFFKQENDESNLDQRQSSNNSAKNQFSFKKHTKKNLEQNKKKKNKERNSLKKEQARLKKINNPKKINELLEKNLKTIGMKTRSKTIKKTKCK